MKVALGEIEALLQPVGLVWLLLIVGGLRLLFRSEWKWSSYCLGLAAVLSVFGGTPLPWHLLAGLERPFDGSGDSPPKADAIVMLGGTHDYTRRSALHVNTADSSDRIFLALELVRSGKAPALVLGGSFYKVNGVPRPDSELLENWFRVWRLPTGRIFRLGICSSTHDEAGRAATLAAEQKWRRILLVSTASHLRRGVAVFKKAGLDVTPVGCDFAGLDGLEAGGLWALVPRLRGFQLASVWIHEGIGWWYYRWQGWV